MELHKEKQEQETTAPNDDHMIIALSKNQAVRLRAIRSTKLVEEARILQGTSKTATVALGQLLTAALLMGSDLKYKQSLTIKLRGSEEAGRMIAVTDENHTVRGTIEDPSRDLPLLENGKYNLPELFGLPGHVIVIKDLQLKEPYQGIVQMQTGWIAKDLSFYLLSSEQTPSAVALGVVLNDDGSVKMAGGYIVSLMPGEEDSKEAIELEKRIAMFPAITTLLGFGDTPAQILELLAGGSINILSKIPVKFQCTCNEERFKRALLALGKKELQSLQEESETVSLECHFCRAQFKFDSETLDELIQQANK